MTRAFTFLIFWDMNAPLKQYSESNYSCLLPHIAAHTHIHLPSSIISASYLETRMSPQGQFKMMKHVGYLVTISVSLSLNHNMTSEYLQYLSF